MIKSVGLDIVEIARIDADVKKYGKRFVERILGEQELIQYSSRVDKILFLSGRFAAKEAVIKGLGKFLRDKPMLTELQIVNDATGQPELFLPDRLKQNLLQVTCHISITHEKSVAAAVVIFSEE